MPAKLIRTDWNLVKPCSELDGISKEEAREYEAREPISREVLKGDVVCEAKGMYMYLTLAERNYP